MKGYNYGQVTSDAFRVITQLAIWYYTDSLTISSSAKLTTAEWNLYNKLINTPIMDDETLNSKSYLNLYLTTGPAYSGDGVSYQNLLSVGTLSSVETTEPDDTTNSLTLRKTVDGTSANQANDSFEFYVLISKYTSSGYTALTGNVNVESSAIDGVETPAYSGTVKFSAYNTSYGYCKVNLKHGQSITFKDLPDDYRYYIWETSNSNYSTEVAATGDHPTYSTSSSGNVYVKQDYVDDKKIEVDYTNTSTLKTLELSKLVKDGDDVDENKEFTFIIYLYDSSSYYYKAVKPSSIEGGTVIDGVEKPTSSSWTYQTVSSRYGSGTDYYGYITVTLKHGQSIILSGLPSGYNYQIQEKDAEEYDTEITTSSDGASIEDSSKTIAEGNVTASLTNIQYENTPQEVETETLEISKRVEDGDSEDEDRKFMFDIYLCDTSTTSYTEVKPSLIEGGTVIEGVEAPEAGDFSYETYSSDWSTSTSSGTDYYGHIVAWLKHGQSVKLSGLPSGYTYQVYERDADDYAAEITSNGANAKPNNDSKYVYEKSVTQSLVNVEYVNRPTVEKVTKSLKLSKEVKGTYADSNQEFDFTITLKDGKGNPLTAPDGLTVKYSGPDAPAETTLPVTNGVVSVSLKHGQSIEITGLPNAYGYSISEAEAEQYEAEITVSTDLDNAAKIDNDTATVTQWSDNPEKTEVKYVNKMEDIVPAGIRIDVTPYAAIMGMLVGFAVLLFVYRRRHV